MSNPEQQSYYDCEDAFRAVVRGYGDIKSLAPVCASNPNPVVGGKRLGPDSIHFIADVERTTERALRGRPQSQAAWFSLLKRQPIEPALEKLVIQRCGAAYLNAGLTPKEYFRPLRATHRAAA